jgi:hypothetical protein
VSPTLIFRHNIDRTVLLNGLISETIVSWISEGVLRPETLYGMGMLNEPHICGTWRWGGYWLRISAVKFGRNFLRISRILFS